VRNLLELVPQSKGVESSCQVTKNREPPHFLTNLFFDLLRHRPGDAPDLSSTAIRAMVMLDLRGEKPD
jgi:hypothetical protein